MSVVVYAPSQFITFAPVTGALDELGLSIHDARLAPAGSGYTLSSYAVLERSESLEASESRLEEIRAGVKNAIERFDINAPQISRRVPRQVRMFSTRTRIEFSNDKAHARTVMELITGDRPGLASRVGRVMVALGIRLLNAKISTVGERAEDVFFLCDRKQRPLTLELREILKQRLLEELELRYVQNRTYPISTTLQQG